MKELNNKWDKIVAKVHLLLEKNQKLEQEVAQLKSQLDKLEQSKVDLQKEKEDLNQSINVLKLAKGVGLSEQERAEVKNQIKHYINEIDVCLAKINA